jgi:hypothetical protein
LAHTAALHAQIYDDFKRQVDGRSAMRRRPLLRPSGPCMTRNSAMHGMRHVGSGTRHPAASPRDGTAAPGAHECPNANTSCFRAWRPQAIDAAKKRAVAQNVDYDTFKAMVSVAHLKPLQAPSDRKQGAFGRPWGLNKPVHHD